MQPQVIGESDKLLPGPPRTLAKWWTDLADEQRDELQDRWISLLLQELVTPSNRIEIELSDRRGLDELRALDDITQSSGLTFSLPMTVAAVDAIVETNPSRALLTSAGAPVLAVMLSWDDVFWYDEDLATPELVNERLRIAVCPDQAEPGHI